MTDINVHYPRLTDNDNGEITVTLEGKELRGWSYTNDGERRIKMVAAREFVEGWLSGYGAGLDRGEALVKDALATVQ